MSTTSAVRFNRLHVPVHELGLGYNEAGKYFPDKFFYVVQLVSAANVQLYRMSQGDRSPMVSPGGAWPRPALCVLESLESGLWVV